MEGSQKTTDEAESGSEQPPIVDVEEDEEVAENRGSGHKSSEFMGWTRRNREPRNGWVEPKKPRNRPWETEKPTQPETDGNGFWNLKTDPVGLGCGFHPKPTQTEFCSPLLVVHGGMETFEVIERCNRLISGDRVKGINL